LFHGNEKNIAIYNELKKRATAARTDTAIDPNEKQRLLIEIAELEKRARAAGVPREGWEITSSTGLPFALSFAGIW